MISLLALSLAAAEAHSQDSKLSRCFTKQNRKASRALLAATSEAEASSHSRKIRLRTECNISGRYSGSYSFKMTSASIDSLRAVVAEILVKEDRAKVAVLPALAVQRMYERPWYPATSRHVSIDEMATCVAETNPLGVLRLLDTASNSPAEQEHFGSLKPSFEVCLRADIKLVGNRAVLRGALADALYQRTQPWPDVADRPEAAQ